MIRLEAMSDTPLGASDWVLRKHFVAPTFVHTPFDFLVPIDYLEITDDESVPKGSTSHASEAPCRSISLQPFVLPL